MFESDFAKTEYIAKDNVVFNITIGKELMQQNTLIRILFDI